MKVTWGGDYVGRIGLTAHPEDYDGQPPVSRLLMDDAPKQLSPDRLAVAAALTFRRYVSGAFEMPHRFSPTTAHAMQKYCAPAWTMPAPVEYYPKILPVGSRRAHLSDSGFMAGSAPTRRDVIDLRVLRSDRYTGSLLSFSGFAVASNAWLHCAADDTVDSWGPLLAVAVLFAEDLLVETITLPPTTSLTADAIGRLRQLLAVARLGLEVSPTGPDPGR